MQLGGLQKKRFQDVSEVRTSHGFAHGTTEIGQSKCFICQAKLKFSCMHVKAELTLNIAFLNSD